MLSDLKTLISYRELLINWTLRDLKVRYKQSLLGVAWAILQPLSMMLIFTAIFSYFVKLPTDGIPYPIFSYAGLLPWTFFATSLSFAAPSLINNMNLVTKIYFPREIFPLAAVFASFVDFLIASSIFLAMILYYRIALGPTILVLPIIILVQIILTVSMALITSAMNVFYRDIRFVVLLGVQLWMYLTPVIYSVSMVPEWLQPLYMLNPMAGIIDSYRRVVLVAQPPDLRYLTLAAVVSLLLLLLAYKYFKSVEMEFADVI